MEDEDIVNLVKYEGRFSFHVKEGAIESRRSFKHLCQDNRELFRDKLIDLELHSSVKNDQEENFDALLEVISTLKNLQLLCFCGKSQFKGRVKTIPTSFASLQNLNYLNLKHNAFEEIPCGIYGLISLKRLDLSYCKIKWISCEINNLKNLIELHVQKNEIKTLPSEISELFKLEQLNLSSNQLAELPSDICQLESLKILRISNNCLQGSFHPHVSKLKAIKVLQCSHNKIDSIDDEFANLPNLLTFDISYNNIRVLSDKIIQLPSVITEGNPFNDMNNALDDLSLSETIEFHQELDACEIEVDVKQKTRHIFPCGIEITIPASTFKKPIKISASLTSGLRNSFKLNDAEQLLSDILLLEPTGTVLDKPLSVKIPFHFKPTDLQTREVIIRCISNLDGKETVEDLSTTRCNDSLASCEVTHFSCFAVVSRLVQVEQTVTGTRDELLFSPIHPETKLWFPKSCVEDKTKITMQILEVDDNLITQTTGNPLAVASHVVMVHVSPPATVFANPVTVTMTLPRRLIGTTNQPKLRLLKARLDSMEWVDVTESVDIQQHATNATFQMNSFSKLWLVTEIVFGVARRVYRRLITYQVQFIAMQLRTAPTLVMAQCLRQEHTEGRVQQLKKAGYIGDDPATPVCELMEGDQFTCKIVGELQQRDSEKEGEIIGTFRSQFPPDKTGFSRFFIEPVQTGYDKKAVGFIKFFGVEKPKAITRKEKQEKLSEPREMKRKREDEYFVAMEMPSHDNGCHGNTNITYVDKVPIFLEPELGEEIILPSSNPQELNYGGLGTGLFRDRVLRILSYDIGREWRLIGTYLGIGHASLDRMEMEHPSDALERTYRMLRLWGQMHMHEEDSVTQFSDALEQAGRTDLSEKIKKIHADGQEAFLQSVKKQKSS